MKPTAFPGHELRQRREELGLSVYEAFRHTRVPAAYIEALERGDIRGLPVSTYAAGFIKSYCVFLQLDSDRFVDTFRSCTRPAHKRFLRANRAERRAAPLWLNDLMTWVAVMGIVLLGWVTYSVVFSPHAEVTDRGVQAGTLELSEPPAPPSGK